jgi:putative flippase GtrA
VVPFERRTKTIVSVGRLDDNKNQGILIRAFGRLMDKYPDYKLVIIGDGDCRGEYGRLAGKTPDPTRIEFTGIIKNVADRISDARIYALTSKEEGLPNALIEAMALGLVAISTDCPCGGPADIISDGENGILIPMGSDEEMEDSLVCALDKVMSDESLTRRLSENALSVREKYSPARINALWKDYFEKIMSEETVVEKSKMQTLIEYIKQFISFGLIGGLNTILSLGIYWLVVYLGGHYLLANAIAFAITVFISYVLNNIFTFKGEGKAEWSLRTLLKVYVSYSITGLFLTSILLWVWTDCLGINENIAPIINLFFTIPLNFLLNKFWAYKKK